MKNNKELFMKWMQNLFYVQCAALVLTLIAKLPFIGSWFSWVIRITSIATIFMLYKLSPLNARYLKSAIFMGVALFTTIFLKGLGVLAIVGMICSIIATYQELIGHSELMKEVDAKLSNNWRSLFNWDLWGGFLISFIVAVIAIAISVAGNVEVAVATTQVYTEGYSILMDVVYLVLMKRMLKGYVDYAAQIEEVVSEKGNVNDEI